MTPEELIRQWRKEAEKCREEADMVGDMQGLIIFTATAELFTLHANQLEAALREQEEAPRVVWGPVRRAKFTLNEGGW